jgi:hypothetical protein
MVRRYILYDEYGHDRDVTAEIQGYLVKIAELEKELAVLKGKITEKPVVDEWKPNVKTIKKGG